MVTLDSNGGWKEFELPEANRDELAALLDKALNEGENPLIVVRTWKDKGKLLSVHYNLDSLHFALKNQK